MTRLDVNYRRFLEYAKQHDEFEKDTLIDFVRHCVSHDSDSCINLLQRVHELIYPTRRGIIISNGILHNLAQVLNNPVRSIKCFRFSSGFRCYYYFGDFLENR